MKQREAETLAVNKVWTTAALRTVMLFGK